MMQKREELPFPKTIGDLNTFISDCTTTLLYFQLLVMVINWITDSTVKLQHDNELTDVIPV